MQSGRPVRYARAASSAVNAGPRPAPRTLADLQAQTPASTALAKELRKRGFVFTGPVTVYAAMQACGLVNDHLEACFARLSTAADIPPVTG